MINSFVMKIKKKETPFYNNLYLLIKKLTRISVPSIKFIHLPLYHIHKRIFDTWSFLIHSLWITPIFKARIDCGGKGLKIINGMPYINGEHLKLSIGDNVTMVGLNQFVAGREKQGTPEIIIGDNVTIGYSCEFTINDRIYIGSNTLIATGCSFADSDGHPIESELRKTHKSVSLKNIRPITVHDNVWIARGCKILKGVTIGENSIISAGSVVTSNTVIPPNEIWGGIPAKKIGIVPEK